MEFYVQVVARANTAWVATVASAQETLDNAIAEAGVAWVEAEASASFDFSASASSAATAWSAKEAAAEVVWKGEMAAANVKWTTKAAEAAKIHKKAYARAALNYANIVWPAWAQYVAKEAFAAAAWSDTSWHAYADYQITIMGAGVTYVNAMSSPRIQYTTAVADANKTYAIAMENITVAKANASASLEVAQVAAADAATFTGVMPKPRSSWLGIAWSFITSALPAIIIGLGLAFITGVLLLSASPVVFFSGVALVTGGLLALALNASTAVMNRAANGQSESQSLGGGLADTFGVSGAYEAIMNMDIATGRNLNLTTEERASRGGEAFGVAVATLLGGKAIKVGTGYGKYVNCFVEGTDVVMAEFDSQAAGSQIATASPYRESDDFSGIAQSNYEVVAGACLLVGVVGAGLSEVNSRRKRNAARRLSRVDALFANEEWDDLEIPRSAYGSFLDDANHDRDDAIGSDLYRFHDESNFMHYAA
jgi:hypothetical protein